MDKKRSVMGVSTISTILVVIVSAFLMAGCLNPPAVQPSGEFCIPDENGVCLPSGTGEKVTGNAAAVNAQGGDSGAKANTPNTATALPDTTTAIIDETPAQNIQRLTYNASELIDLKARLKVNDQDNNILTYKFSAPFSTDGKWQTSLADAGEYLVTITVSDGASEISKKVLVVVKAQNRPPAIGKMSDLTVSEGEKVILSPVAVDPDGDSLTITYSGWMTDKEYATKFGDIGEHFVTVTASDGREKAVQIVKVIVKRGNREPVLKPFSDVTVEEGDKVSIVPEASDPDGDKITFSFTAPFDQQGVWQTKENDQGAYKVTVTASDGMKSVTQTFSLVVKGKNKAPMFQSIQDKTVNENQTVSFIVSAADPENDVVTIAATDLPVGATFDTKTREFSWRPDFDAVTATEGKKKFTATFSATDGKGSSTYTAVIYVTHANRIPNMEII